MSYFGLPWQAAAWTIRERCAPWTRSPPMQPAARATDRHRQGCSKLLQLLIVCLIQLVSLQNASAGCDARPDDPSWMHGEAIRLESEIVTTTVDQTALHVSLSTGDPQLVTEDVSSWLFVAVGPMAVPAALANPFAIFGVLFPVIGPPVNAAFRSKRGALVHALCSESLPAAVLTALGTRLREAPLPAVQRVDVRIAVYGLSPISGKAPRVFADDVKMCLVASFSLAAQTAERAHEWPGLGVGVGAFAKSDDAPPPVCASFGRFAAEDGKYLRQAIQETAEVMAAMAVSRLEVAR